MSQHDYNLSNQNGAAFRSDLNNLLLALATWNAGDAEPDPTFPFMPWPDTANNKMKVRNEANTDWVIVGDLDTVRWGNASAKSLFGKLTKSVAGSADVTLTADEAENGIIVLTGVLTGDIDVILPTSDYQWVIFNNTTGSFNLTAKTAAGTGVVIQQNSAVTLFCDGTNIVSAGAGGQTAMTKNPFTAASTGANSFSLVYTPGNLIVVKNGAVTEDYTATNGTSVDVTCSAGDEFEIYSFSSFSVANAVAKSGDTMSGDLTMGTGTKVKLAASSGSYKVDLAAAALTAHRTATFPDANLTVAGRDVEQIFTQKQVFAATLKMQQALEKITITAAAPSATQNFDALTQAIQYFTTNAANNWTLNVRGDGSNSLDSLMAVGESITVTVLAAQGATPYYPNAHQIDGSAITPKWLGGTAPSAGDASSINVYTYTIVKTAAATFTMLASKSKYA